MRRGGSTAVAPAHNLRVSVACRTHAQARAGTAVQESEPRSQVRSCKHTHPSRTIRHKRDSRPTQSPREIGGEHAANRRAK
eukprot:1892437-Rhodomonas_salina.2